MWEPMLVKDKALKALVGFLEKVTIEYLADFIRLAGGGVGFLIF